MDRWELLLLLAVMTAHIVFSPFNKVEESFNLQALHDMLNFGPSLEKYDHHEFPGVVPRTFIGALFIAAVSKPLVLIVELLSSSLGLLSSAKLVQLFFVRFVLGSFSCLSLVHLKRSLSRRFGVDVGAFFIALFSCQFHIAFYMSRTLPNTFAFILVNLALSNFLDRRMTRVMTLLAFAAIVFRFEVALLAVPLMLVALLRGYVGFFRAAAITITVSMFALALSVAVDSWFWQRWLWPEGEVLFFNTVENKSGEWGVSPWHWYFSTAIPKTMSFATLFVIPGLLIDLRESRALLEIALPSLIFVAIYSFLPHKELRFIFYVFPVLNACAALAYAKMSRYTTKSEATGPRILAILWATIPVVLVLASAILAAGFTFVSSSNYPGGTALWKLHQLHPGKGSSVHIDVEAAMTGVSRFLELRPDMLYSKREDLTQEGLISLNFTYLITPQSSIPGYRQVALAEGFSGIQRDGMRVQVLTKPLIYILERINR